MTDTPNPLLVADALDVIFDTYRGPHQVLHQVSFQIAPGEILGVVGESGAGKSMTGLAVAGLIEAPGQLAHGSVMLEGVRIDTLQGEAIRRLRGRRIGMVFQEYNLVERLSVMENLLTGRLGYVSPLNAWLRRFPAEDIAYAYRLLDIVGLAAFANQRADSLSGGQRQRVGIARALMQRPEILLADEPTSSLDPKTSVEIMELLKSQGMDNQIPVLVNIHDVNLARRYADRIVGMTGGKVVFDGAPATLTDADLNTIYGGKDWLQ